MAYKLEYFLSVEKVEKVETRSPMKSIKTNLTLKNSFIFLP